jgi:hypothetical protein|nr:MAG TPA: voltage-gated hydrogen channel protein [Caudoviricetes sp.]
MTIHQFWCYLAILVILLNLIPLILSLVMCAHLDKEIERLNSLINDNDNK